MTRVFIDPLPDSAYPRCAYCGEPVQESTKNLRQKIGWVQEREQGGTNHLIAGEYTGLIVGWNCAADCAAKARRGVPPGQGTLL